VELFIFNFIKPNSSFITSSILLPHHPINLSPYHFITSIDLLLIVAIFAILASVALAFYKEHTRKVKAEELIRRKKKGGEDKLW